MYIFSWWLVLINRHRDCLYIYMLVIMNMLQFCLTSCCSCAGKSYSSAINCTLMRTLWKWICEKVRRHLAHLYRSCQVFLSRLHKRLGFCSGWFIQYIFFSCFVVDTAPSMRWRVRVGHARPPPTLGAVTCGRATPSAWSASSSPWNASWASGVRAMASSWKRPAGTLWQWPDVTASGWWRHSTRSAPVIPQITQPSFWYESQQPQLS